jgi:UDP-N-acetylmuramyl tripeptide synthase
MAVAAAVSRGADPEKAVAALEAIREVAGRFTRQDYRGRQVRLLLAKNPAGWLELIELVGQGDAPLVLAFNSEGVDGRDPSWLYDVSFEGLAGRPIAVVGRRATDMQVRLRMDGLDPVVVRGGLLDALTTLPPGPVDVLANYTAFQDSRRELARAQ